MSLANYGNGLSAADVAAVTNNNGNGNGFGFGGDGAWWLLVLFLFAMNGNWGNNGIGGGAPYMMNNFDNGVQRGFDQSAIMNGITGVNAAITNGFSNAAVAQCNQRADILQGFSGIQAAIANGNAGLNNTMMQNEMARQQCCCETKQAIADLKYTVATEACADRTALANATRDIIDAQRAGTQAILDRQCQAQIDDLKTQNANLLTQLNMQHLAASQATQTAQLIQDNNAQTAALINRIAPYPVPSYTVANPYVSNACGGGWSNSCCGNA